MNRLPPGPSNGLLGLGSVKRFRQAPLRFVTSLARDYGDLAYFRLGPYRACLVNHPELIHDVLVTHRKVFPKLEKHCRVIRCFSGNNLFVSDGDAWLRQRRLVQPAFHPRRLAHYANTAVEQTRRMLRDWSPETTLELTEQMASLVLAIVGQALFNVDLTQCAARTAEALHIRSRTFVREMGAAIIMPDWLPTPGKRRKRWALKYLDDMIWTMIRERRAAGTDQGDLLSTLLLTVDEDGDGQGMTDQQVRDETMTLLNAGQDDTTAALSWTWYLLARHPRIEARFREEVRAVIGDRPATFADVARMPFTEMVIKESMRLYPPTWCLLAREAQQDQELGGYVIPRGSWVFISPYATHHDPRFFPDPEQFDPERFSPERAEQTPPFAYIPFGGGPRGCVGNGFSMMTIALVLATVAQRYRLRLVDDPERVVPDPSLALRPKGGLRVHLQATVTAELGAAARRR
jgi:cytochrome P450